MLSSILAVFAAASIFWELFSLKKSIFSLMVSENRKVSWGTLPIRLLRTCRGIFSISVPSIKRVPGGDFKSLGIRLTRVVFPLPVRPIIPSVLPACSFKLMSFKTGLSVPG